MYQLNSEDNAPTYALPVRTCLDLAVVSPPL